MILPIAKRELRSLFMSPRPWWVLAIVQFILAYLFLSHLATYLAYQPQLLITEGAPGVTAGVVGTLFNDAAVVLLFVTPLITMGLISEELHTRTINLLFSSPLSSFAIILGKYLGAMAFLAILLGLIGLMPLGLLSSTELDFGLLGAAWLGLMLLVAASAAIGLFVSTLTASPALAATGSFSLLLLLWIVDWAGDSLGNVGELLRYLSLAHHYQALLQGLFDSADLVYYLLLSGAFLTLAVWRLETHRLATHSFP